MKSPLIEKYGDQKRFVNWRLEERKGKQTKVPYSIYGRMASSTDPDTWAKHSLVRTLDKNVGIVFTPDKLLLGIDLDDCVNSGVVDNSVINELLTKCDTYCELSPSETGLHLYLELTEPLTLTANRHDKYEAYTSGRYFTVTNVPFGDVKNVRLVSPDEALGLLAIIGYPWKKEKEEEVSPSNRTIMDLADSQILERMFASKNGPTIRALYEGSASAHGDDYSRADMALLTHLAFWFRKDAQKIEAIWLASPMGARKKTVERSDYRTRSIAYAIGNCTDVYGPTQTTVPASIPFLCLNKVPSLNMENMARVFRQHADFVGKLRFDSFKNCVEVALDSRGWREMEDNDAVILQSRISILFPAFLKVTKAMIWDALVMVAKESTIDSGADYMKGLVWDKVPRLNSWLSEVYGVPNDIYHQSVGSNWLKGLVKRVIEPGCKFDFVLVLEGQQDLKKSMSLKILGGDWYVETTMSTDTKDFFMQFLGKALIEFSEGETLSRTETKRMKAIITTQSDRYRPSYGRSSMDFPRRCVFAMTTNQEEYLKDETGNRRWLPVAVQQVANVEWLKENREQLFAEGFYRVVSLKETTYELPVKETREAQDQRRVHDPNEDTVLEWFMNVLTPVHRREGITILMAIQQSLNSGFGGNVKRQEEMSMAEVFKRTLKLERRRVMIGNVRAWRWYPTDLTPKTMDVIEQPTYANF